MNIIVCDRCNDVIKSNVNSVIFKKDKCLIKELKTFDICDKCYKDLIFDIKNYGQHTENKKELWSE